MRHLCIQLGVKPKATGKPQNTSFPSSYTLPSLIGCEEWHILFDDKPDFQTKLRSMHPMSCKQSCANTLQCPPGNPIPAVLEGPKESPGPYPGGLGAADVCLSKCLLRGGCCRQAVAKPAGTKETKKTKTIKTDRISGTCLLGTDGFLYQCP